MAIGHFLSGIQIAFAGVLMLSAKASASSFKGRGKSLKDSLSISRIGINLPSRLRLVRSTIATSDTTIRGNCLSSGKANSVSGGHVTTPCRLDSKVISASCKTRRTSQKCHLMRELNSERMRIVGLNGHAMNGFTALKLIVAKVCNVPRIGIFLPGTFTCGGIVPCISKHIAYGVNIRRITGTNKTLHSSPVTRHSSNLICGKNVQKGVLFIHCLLKSFISQKFSHIRNLQ